MIPVPEIVGLEPKAKGIPTTKDIVLKLVLEYILDKEKYKEEEEAVLNDTILERAESIS